MNDKLEKLLQKNPRLWRGTGRTGPGPAGIPTGHEPLDAHLPGGGWPVGALTEILVEHPGSGELRLVMPALANLSRRDDPGAGRWLAWVAPPHVPYAPALAASGVDLARVLIIHARDGADIFWSAEQALRSGTCAAVLLWVQRADEKSLRRLQLAAEAGGSWGIVFRPPSARRCSSPAALRLHLIPGSDGKVVHVFKTRGGQPVRLTADFLNP